MRVCTLFTSILFLFGCSTNSSLPNYIQFEVIDSHKSTFEFSVTTQVMDANELVKYWYKKGEELCHSQNFITSKIEKINRTSSQVEHKENDTYVVKVTPSIVTGVIGCNGT
jgi:hypothetical protein